MTAPLPAPVKAVHRAWGPHVHELRTSLSLLEGHPAECAEFAVHEFCHAALLGVFTRYGRCNKDGVTVYVEAGCNGIKEKWLEDRNEIQTLAAESLVLRELGIDVSFSTLLCLGIRNVKLFRMDQKYRLSRCIRRARSTPRVRRAAAAVVEFIRNGKGKVLAT